MHLKLVEKSAERLRFRNTRGSGWVFGAVGVVLTAASVKASGLEAWFMLLFALPCLAIGGWAVLVRTELTFDLLAGRFEARRGYWPSPRTYRGSIDQIQRVCLRRCRSGRDRDGDGWADNDDWHWMVVLDLKDWPRQVIYWSRSEVDAEEQFEHYAKLFQVPAVDLSQRTRAVSTEDILERLENVETEKPFILGQPSGPPQSGAIVWRENAGAAIIELPRGGYLGGAWFPLAFGGAFFTAGVLLVCASMGVIRFDPGQPLGWAGGILFSSVGALILGLLTVGLCSRQIVREEADQILFEINMLGKSLHTRRWPKQQVEKIVRIKVPGRVPARGPTISEKEKLGLQATEVVVQRGEDVVRLARGADEPTQQWLCLTLQQLVAR